MMQGNNGAATLLIVLAAVLAVVGMFGALQLTNVSVLLLAIALLVSKNDGQ